MRAKFLLLLLPLLPGPLFPATGFLVHDLKVPMYDAAGQLTHTLTAVSAEGALDRPVLKSGIVEFHTALGKSVAPGARLSFDEAVYDKAGGFLEGTGPVRFAAQKGDLSGVGFHYELATGRLKLHRDVLLEPKGEKYQGTKIRGQTADALVRQNPADRSWILDDTLITGPVVATDVKIQKTRFDRVETDRVNYSAVKGTVDFAPPVTTWRNGEKAVLGGGLIQYQLDPAPPADPAPAPASAPRHQTP